MPATVGWASHRGRAIDCTVPARTADRAVEVVFVVAERRRRGAGAHIARLSGRAVTTACAAVPYVLLRVDLAPAVVVPVTVRPARSARSDLARPSGARGRRDARPRPHRAHTATRAAVQDVALGVHAAAAAIHQPRGASAHAADTRSPIPRRARAPAVSAIAVVSAQVDASRGTVGQSRAAGAHSASADAPERRVAHGAARPAVVHVAACVDAATTAERLSDGTLASASDATL